MVHFNQEWHGVPAGTEVEITDRTERWCMGKDPALKVRRVDGADLPTHYGIAEFTWVAPEYIDERPAKAA